MKSASMITTARTNMARNLYSRDRNAIDPCCMAFPIDLTDSFPSSSRSIFSVWIRANIRLTTPAPIAIYIMLNTISPNIKIPVSGRV